jgi:predicted transcriptional regulator
MEVHLTPEQEARLTQLAARIGKKDAQEIVQETVARLLENEARVTEAVKRGIASADRGDLLEHDEVVARVERLLRT